MRIAHRRRLMAGLLILAFAAASGHVLAETVNLDAAPSVSRTVDLEEVWRLGGDEDDVLLGVIFAGALGDDGNVRLVDRQLSQVLVVSPDGDVLETLGRQGEGPGELNRPHGLFLLDDGTVAVTQGFPGKATLIRPNGDPGGEIVVDHDPNQGGFANIRSLKRCGDRLVGVHGRMAFDQDAGTVTRRENLSVLDMDGKVLSRLVTTERTDDFGRPSYDERAEFSEMAQWTVAPDGAVYTAPERDAYVINVRTLDGDVVRTLKRPFTPRHREPDDKDAVTDGMVMVINGVRQEIDGQVLDDDPAIMGLDAAADGRLFVTNCHQQRRVLPDGVAARYDVIPPDGSRLEELTLRYAGFDRETDRVLFLDGVHFLLVRNFDLATASMFAPPGGGGNDDAADAGDAEPLEVVFLRTP